MCARIGLRLSLSGNLSLKDITMKKEFLCTCLIALPAASAAAVISGSVNVTTNYLFKGVSLSGEKVALQPYVEYSDDSGFYASAWESNIDFSATDRFGQSVRYASNELDIASGFRWTAGQLSLDLGVGTYSYFGSADSVQQDQSRIRASDINYFDVYVRANRKNTSFSYSFAPNYAGFGIRHSIFSLSQGVALPAEFRLTLASSYLYSHDDNGFYQQASSPGYIHFSVAVQKRVARLDWAFALEAQNNRGDFAGSLTPVLTVSLPF